LIHVDGNIFRDVFATEELFQLCASMGKNDKTGFDLSGVRFIEPYGILQLLLAGRQYLRLTGNLAVLHGLQPEVAAYLERMDFFKAGNYQCDVRELERAGRMMRNSSSRRLLEITEIPARKETG
jgi:anti-anti-sigma regulatory factor